MPEKNKNLYYTRSYVVTIAAGILLLASIVIFFVITLGDSGLPESSLTIRDNVKNVGDRPSDLFAQYGVFRFSVKEPDVAVESKMPTGEIEDLIKIPWGGDKSSLGRLRPAEGNPEGPMSFTIDDEGRILVLDQVNGRLQVFEDGLWVRSIPVPAETFHDFALAPNGRIAALDRFSGDEVVFLSERGKVESRVRLAGLEIPEGGLTTGLFSRPDGTWVEVEHERLVQVADERGQPVAARKTLPGRPSRDGRWLLQALREGPGAAVVLVRPAENPETVPVLLARVEFPLPVVQLTALESDRAGRVYLAAIIARFDESDPTRVLEEYEPVVVLSPEGRELGRAVFPPRTLPEESLVPIRVAPGGAIYQMAFTESGVVFRRAVL